MTPSVSRNPDLRSYLLLLAACLALPLMITRESLWLDEGDTAIYAIQPTFGEWLAHLQNDRNADCQMPLTMFTAWVSGQVLGTGELALRLQNGFWAVLALVALYRTGKNADLPWLPLVLIVQPFFWFYMDEARPYLAQLALGAVLLCLLSSLSANLQEPKKSSRWLACFLAAIFVIYSASMLCAVMILAVVMVLAVAWPKDILRMLARNRLAVFIFTILFGALSAYYVWTLTRGAAGARIWAVDLKSIGFIFYEWIGCLGLGSSLDQIRETANHGRLADLLPSLAAPGLLGLLLGGLIFAYLRQRKRATLGSSLTLKVVAMLAFVISCLVIASYILHKPLWARHFSSILPLLVFLEAAALQSAFNSGKFWLRASAVLLSALLIASSLQIRFSPRFEKDDYRTAAHLAKTALLEGKIVWWSAAEYTAQYYQLPLSFGQETTGARVMHATPLADGLAGGMPDLIITTRPEVFDPAGVIPKYIKEQAYQILPSPKNFSIYAKTSL